MSGLLIVVVAATVAGITYLLLAQSAERALVRSSLRQLRSYEVENLRDRALLETFSDRAMSPFLTRAVQLSLRLSPTSYLDSLRRQLVLAGDGAADDVVDQFLAVRVVSSAAGILVAALTLALLPIDLAPRLLVSVLIVAMGLLLPDARLRQRVAKRQFEIRVRLPDILDLLVISVEAGLGFEQALSRTVNAVPGPLSTEFRTMLGQMQAGASRADALRALDTRTDVFEVRSFVLALLQADTFGVSISRVLRTQAADMRIKRRQMAQEMAAKAPVKMLIPMVLCVFPALIVVVLFPAMYTTIDALSDV